MVVYPSRFPLSFLLFTLRRLTLFALSAVVRLRLTRQCFSDSSDVYYLPSFFLSFFFLRTYIYNMCVRTCMYVYMYVCCILYAVWCDVLRARTLTNIYIYIYIILTPVRKNNTTLLLLLLLLLLLMLIMLLLLLLLLLLPLHTDRIDR